MAPKKTRTRESSSQPAAEADTQTRKTARKRRNSDASNASVDRPSSSQSNSTPSGPKRRKRARVVDEPEAIAEEDETIAVTQENHAEQEHFHDDDDIIEVHSSQSKHVHFGQASTGAEANDDAADETLEKTTATHITPHPRKMTIKRRVTASPSVRSADGSKRVKVTTSRTSLPASLFQNGKDPFYLLEEHHFAPLRDVLQERVRRRLALHAGQAEHLEELDLELETQSQLGNVERVQELRETIATLRKEHKQILAEGDVAEELDNEMLVLDGNEEFSYPQLPALTSSSETKASGASSFNAESLTLTESQSMQEAWSVERRNFEDAIVALSREANDAKTELQILKIELMALGFGAEGVSVSTVLLSIRDSFTRIREGLELALPGSLPEGASNQNVIEILLANVKDFADRLHTQDHELQQRTTLISDLGQQVHGLVDHLAEARIRNQKLEQGWSELDRSNEEKSRRLGSLEEELQKTEEERDVLGDDLFTKAEESQTLQGENLELSKSLDRLTESLQKYREEETRLTELISKMEEEHRVGVAKMNSEREKTVRELEEQIDKHAELRQAAEVLAEERQTMIISLELRIETIDEERNTLTAELERMTVVRDEQLSAREAAEADLQDKSVEVQDLEDRVDRLEEELTPLNAQLAELRQVHETERTQREEAEAELDERNAKVEELNKRLHEQGVQANELRQKLFEVQQINAQKIKDLEAAASERDEQYQIDIATEVERRETADGLAQQHADTIVDLETRLERLEMEMRDTIATRDERIEALEEEVAEKISEIDILRNDLQVLEARYASQVADSTQQREDFEASITALQLNIAEREKNIAALQLEATRMVSLHDSETEDRNTHIADLNYRLTAAETQITELQAAKISLEHRVEQEAEQMLQLQAEQQDEVATLRATIRDKQAKIQLVEQKVQETDASWQEVLAARDEEITTLTTSSKSASYALSATVENLAMLKKTFTEYVHRTSRHISRLRGALDDARGVIEGESDAVTGDGLEMLAQIEAMAERESMNIMTASSQQTFSSTQVSSQQSSQAVAKKTRGRKRRVVDSGIGLLDGEDELDGA